MKVIRRSRTAQRARRKLGDAGFTAVELIVGIVLMGILMMGFLTVFPLGMRSVQKGEGLSQATSLAQDAVERLKQLPRTDPDLVAGTHVDPDNPIGGVFNRTWDVVDDTPLAGMKTVTIAIQYSDNGIPRNIRLSTYLSS